MTDEQHRESQSHDTRAGASAGPPPNTQVPPSVEQSEDRVKERDYDSDFARFPEHEAHPVETPGSGPSGSVATTNGPIVLMGLGALVALSVFVFQSPWVLGLGLVIFLAAAIWAGIANRGPGTMAGSGTSVIERDDDHH